MSASLLSMATRWSRITRALDLAISVDTTPAHLAVTLGVPVWTFLDVAANWPWMDRPEESPWYPTMRLLRQESPGAWKAVIVRVVADPERRF
jgi:ADP-heptose:LPS heptosyltransferase